MSTTMPRSDITRPSVTDLKVNAMRRELEAANNACACCGKRFRGQDVRNQLRVKETGLFVPAGADCYRKVCKAGSDGLVLNGIRYVY